MPLEGIDVSAHQQGEPRTVGLSFLFARATYGPSLDGKFADHIAAAKAAGLDTGSYLFLLPKSYCGVSVDDQVAVYLRASDAAGVDYYCIDWEGESDAHGNVIHDAPTKAEMIRSVRLVQAAGHRCGVYSSEGYPYPSVGQDFRWVANYSREPRIRYDIWQYQGSPIDRNRMKTPLEEFRRKAGKAAPSTEMKYILAYDPPKTVSAPAGTILLDLAYNPIATQSTPTHFTTVGLADGHTGKYVVKVSTSRYAPDHKPRATWQVAIIPGTEPEDA